MLVDSAAAQSRPLIGLQPMRNENCFLLVELTWVTPNFWENALTAEKNGQLCSLD